MKYTVKIEFSLNEKHFAFVCGLFSQIFIWIAFSHLSLSQISSETKKTQVSKVENITVLKPERRTVRVVKRKRSSVGHKRTNHSPGTNLDSLLSNISKKSLVKKDVKFSKVDSVNRSGKDLKNLMSLKGEDVSMSLSEKADLENMSFDSKDFQMKSHGHTADIENILSEIQTKSIDYQQCYEKVLLKDKSLEGKITMKLFVVGKRIKSTTIDFNGKGKTASVNLLKNCLSVSNEKVKFEKENLGRKVQFSLLFKS